MYDPARDIFTSSDDAAADGNVTGEHSDGHEAQLRGSTSPATPLQTGKRVSNGPILLQAEHIVHNNHIFKLKV